MDVIGIDVETARIFAGERGRLRREGVPIPDLDLLIGATALRFGFTLISRDKHFDRIVDLRRPA